jgi:uncharacterized damage-inducible protein DinB
MANIDLSRVYEYYHRYINYVTENDLTKAFQKHQTDLISVLKEIPEGKWEYRYEEGKWSVKELVQHVIDSERIFCYRALCFARKDKTALPGFDENTYAEASKADRRSKKDLIEELQIAQQSSAQMFASFDEEQLNESGVANGKAMYVKAIGYILIGHALHHKKILLERYLQPGAISA